MLDKTYKGKAADLGFGHLGNGITVWDRIRSKFNDYAIVAHISADRKISLRELPLSEEQLELITEAATKHDPQVSFNQTDKVFITRPV